jgi:hypothetical protein
MEQSMPTTYGVIRGGVAVAVVLLAATLHVYAGRPLEVDDADTVEEGRVQVEFGLELETGANAKTLTAPFKPSFGLTRWLEIGIEPSALYVEDEEASPRRAAGPGDVVLDAKIRLPVSFLDTNLAIAPSLKIPTADERRGLGTGKVDAGMLLIATRAFTDDQQVHFNVGYTYVGKVRGEQLRDVLFVGIAGETYIPRLASERFQVVGVVFGTTKEESGGRSDIQGRVGVRYQLVEDFILDAAVGRSPTPDPEVELFATVGFTWTFDTPWKLRRSGPPLAARRCTHEKLSHTCRLP